MAFIGTSLVAQWLRIHLPMQGTWVQSLVREDPTCHGAAKPVHGNYWACALEPASHNYWSPHAYSPCSATRETTATRGPHTAMKSSLRSPQLEKACVQQWRPKAAKSIINKRFLLCWDVFPLYHLEFLSWMDVEFSQMLFFASFEMFIWFLSFLWLMWCITLIDLPMLNHPCDMSIDV